MQVPNSPQPQQPKVDSEVPQPALRTGDCLIAHPGAWVPESLSTGLHLCPIHRGFIAMSAIATPARTVPYPGTVVRRAGAGHHVLVFMDRVLSLKFAAELLCHSSELLCHLERSLAVSLAKRSRKICGCSSTKLGGTTPGQDRSTPDDAVASTLPAECKSHPDPSLPPNTQQNRGPTSPLNPPTVFESARLQTNCAPFITASS